MDFALMKALAKGAEPAIPEKRMKAFSQGDFMVTNKLTAGMVAHSQNGGVCRALSIEYLVHNFARRRADVREAVATDRKMDDVDEHFFAKLAGKRDFASVISSAQTFGAFAGGDQRAKMDAIAKTVATLSAGTMKEGAFESHTRISLLNKLTLANPDFVYVSSGAHAMAIVAIQKGAGSKYKFFDPNYGQVVFENAVNLGKFLYMYFQQLGFQNHDEFWCIHFG